MRQAHEPQVPGGATPAAEEMLVVVSRLELSILSNGLTETLEAVEDWEFQTRVGIGADQVRQLRDQIRTLLDQNP